MKRFPILLMLASIAISSCGQTDQSGSLEQARNSLQNKKTSVSDILSDKGFMSLHPLNSFRELIREHANTGVLVITTPDEPGKKITVTGIVLDKNGAAVPGALVYLYQTDHRGWYAAEAPHIVQQGGDVGHARLFGYVRTDAAGKFELHTIKPAGYPQSDLPAHIHVHVTASGYREFINEFLFDDDERLQGSIREQAKRNRFLIEKPVAAPAGFDQKFVYSITLSQ